MSVKQPGLFRSFGERDAVIGLFLYCNQIDAVTELQRNVVMGNSQGQTNRERRGEGRGKKWREEEKRGGPRLDWTGQEDKTTGDRARVQFSGLVVVLQWERLSSVTPSPLSPGLLLFSTTGNVYKHELSIVNKEKKCQHCENEIPGNYTS